MNKIKTITSNIVSENILKIKELFPDCVIETKDKNGNTTLKIDFETLKQELSDDVIKDDIIKSKEIRYDICDNAETFIEILGHI